MKVIDYDSREQAFEAVARRHGLEPDELDFFPAPGDDQDFYFVSYGPDDDDVDLARWPEEASE